MEESIVKVGRYLYMAAVVAGLAVSWSLWHPVNGGNAAQCPEVRGRIRSIPSRYRTNWVTGEIGGTCMRCERSPVRRDPRFPDRRTGVT
jgi:hypothetical protein